MDMPTTMPNGLSDASDIDQPPSQKPTTSADLQPHYPGQATWEDKAACRIVDALNKQWEDLNSKISAIPKDDQGTFPSELAAKRLELHKRLTKAYEDLQNAHMRVQTWAGTEHGNQDEGAGTTIEHAPSDDRQSAKNGSHISTRG